MTPLLQAQGVTKIFGGGLLQRAKTIALRNFTFTVDVQQPTITGIVGESGSGKSTMARLLLGLESPSEGAVLYQGQDLRQLGRQEQHTFRTDVQAVFQDPFEVFNSVYHVDHVLNVPIRKFGLASSNRDRRSLIEEVLQAVGLRPDETLGRYPHQLSGGQRQRIMVARALLLKPKLIIADEPVSMIDASLRAAVLTSLRRLRDEFGISLIYITHDLTTAFQICDDIIVLYRGGVAEAGSAERVVQQPQHPYTQLLVGSIPRPDPAKLWPEEPTPSALAAQAKAEQGCLFAARCPHTFARCLEEAPPFFRTAPRQAATCYLHQDAPVLAFDQMDQLLKGGERTVQPS